MLATQGYGTGGNMATYGYGGWTGFFEGLKEFVCFSSRITKFVDLMSRLP